ncbi:Glucose-responsive transcription factor [Rhodotorula kratochvilovae]
MESGDGDEQPQKKRRVTRACDQCRRRRIKCEAYPRAPLDSPCVICTEAGAAEGCTFSRPAKKRGPQAGKAKSLEERCGAFERLMGYLLTIVPSLEAHVESFVASTASAQPSSPDAPTPSSSTSNIFTSPESQQAAYSASRIPELMDSVLPPLVPAREAAKQSKRGAPSSSSGADAAAQPPKEEECAPLGLAAAKFPSPAAFAALPDPPAALRGPGHPPPFATFAGAGAQLSLHALADAAVPDFDPGARAPSRGNALDVPELPGEATRNLLLDLYFNQVGQPCLPMLDKSRFLRWSAHLPPSGSSSSSNAPTNPSLLLPPALYLSVFALSISYLPPSSPLAYSTHPSEVYARAARTHLMREVLLGGGAEGARVETCQAAVICALVDWGAGEIERAWMLSALALSLALRLSLHLSPSLLPDPSSLKLKTFHSVLIVHTLLSLRLDRPPLTVLEDYDVPIPPVDEAENWDLWRADKGAAELRDEWGATGTAPGEGESPPGAAAAVRSNALLTFARLAQLCAVGLGILRWSVCPRRGNGQGLAAGEQERAELAAGLAAWEEMLEPELRLGDARGGVEKLGERARWTVEMQMLVAALYLKLRPHPSFASVTLDPVPQALGLLNHVLARYRTSFTLYRSLPTLDVTLHVFSRALFEQSDYAPHHHDVVLRAYDELGRVFPTARTSGTALAAKVDEHKRELGLLRGIHPTTSTHPSPFSAPAPAPIAEPFQAFLSYSADLGPHASPSTVLDFGSWDQTDLLVSLGLVMDPAGASGGGGASAAAGGMDAGAWNPLPGWGDPTAAAGGGTGPLPLPLPIEGVLGGAFPAPAPAAATYFPPPPPVHSHSQMAISPAAAAAPPPAPQQRHSLPNVPGAPSPFPSAAPSPADTTGQQRGEGTDLLTRWLDRGSLGFGMGTGTGAAGQGGGGGP